MLHIITFSANLIQFPFQVFREFSVMTSVVVIISTRVQSDSHVRLEDRKSFSASHRHIFQYSIIFNSKNYISILNLDFGGGDSWNYS